MNLLLTPTNFPDYQLLDSGDFEKLERFGEYILIRPEPQALWDKKLSAKEWEKTAHVRFVPKSSSSGEWKMLKKMQERWKVSYQTGNRDMAYGPRLIFRLGLTSFKHVGIFPEQAVNWDYIYNNVTKLKEKANGDVKFLNLFAYTGGASLAARAAGAQTFHLDSIKQVVTWANENAQLSGLSDIRWIIEDALSYVKREVKRGNKYHGIILDPPAYGHGPKGEKWKLEDNINEMMKLVLQLLDEDAHFLILNAYSLGLSSLVAENLLRDKAGSSLESGELFLQSDTGQKLPLGVFGRFTSVK